MSPWGMPSSLMTVSASITAAMPALSSPPKMVVPSLQMVPSLITGLMPLPGETVSIWALNRMLLLSLSPESFAMRFPEFEPVFSPASSMVTSRPRSVSSFMSTRAKSLSSLVGLSILTYFRNLSRSLSLFILYLHVFILFYQNPC